MMPVKPERKAQLEAYAKEHGLSLAEALDCLLAAQLEADEVVKGALRGYQDVKAGRTSSAEEVFETLNRRYDEIKNGKVKLIPGDEVFAELRAKSAARRAKPR